MVYGLLLTLLLSLSLNVGLWFRFVWRSSNWKRRAAVRVSMLSLSTLLILLVVEVCFYQFVAVSDGFGFTLAAARWRDKYQGPLNQAGFRDREPDLKRFEQRQALIVAGEPGGGISGL